MKSTQHPKRPRGLVAGNWKLATITVYCLLLFLAMSSVRFAAAQAECTAAEGDPIQLGAIFPQGALFSAETATSYQGVEAMTAAVNNCGGVNGRPVEWVYEPAASYDQASEAARDLIVRQRLPLIMGSGLQAVNEGGRAVADEFSVLYWEVTEAAEPSGEWYFTPRLTKNQLGTQTGGFVSLGLSDVLGGAELRTALIYESRGEATASAIRDALPVAPIIDFEYTDNLRGSYNLAVQMRDSDVNTVIIVGFERDGDRLWYAAREADADVLAWIHVGSEGYKRGLCQRLGNTEAFIGIDATGPISTTYRETALGSFYTDYRQNYIQAHTAMPTDEADLAASGVYLLLKQVLPTVQGDYTTENIRAALLALNTNDALGLFGEGLNFSAGNGLNAAPGIVVQQQQGGDFCSTWPGSIATCAGGLLAFPTWEARAKMDELGGCGGTA